MSGWVAGAIVVGAVVQSESAKSAAKKQAGASQNALQEQARQFDIQQENQQPYLEHGKTALDTYANEIDSPFDASKVQMEPGYQFGLAEGQKAIDRKTAAAGGRISGASLKAAAQYGTNYATTGFDAAYNRQNQARSDRLNRLAALAGIGQTATQQVGQAGQNYANSAGNIMTAQGNASGAASIAQGNIWGNTGNQIAALYGRNKAGSTTNNNSGGGQAIDTYNSNGTAASGFDW